MLQSKLKKIKTIYIVFSVIYSFIIVFGIFLTIAECLVFENTASTVLVIINYVRQIAALVKGYLMLTLLFSEILPSVESLDAYIWDAI